MKGEITLIIGKPVANADDRPIREAFDDYLAKGLSRMDAIKAVAKDRGCLQTRNLLRFEN